LNTIASLPTSTLPTLASALPRVPASSTTLTDRVELGSARPSPAAERAQSSTESTATRSPLTRIAAIGAGVVGGALVGGAVAAASGFAGLQLGGLILSGKLLTALPEAAKLCSLLQVSQAALIAAPVLGAVGGGIVGACAARPLVPASPSQIPGSGVALDQSSAHALPSPGAALSALVAPYAASGVRVHELLAHATNADSRGEAAKLGASAGAEFGHTAGRIGGRIMGLAQGACLGALLTGLPATFSPWTAVPVALVAALGLSNTTATLGGALGGALAAPLGAAAAAISHAGHKPATEAR
jgi:hypothetical protein